MYMPGRLRTGSRPSRTVMSLAVYVAGTWEGSQVLRFSGSRVLGFGGARFFGARFLPVSQKPLLMTTCGAAHAGYLSVTQARFVENQLPRTKNQDPETPRPRATREPENLRTCL